jgi:hypothetical protein
MTTTLPLLSTPFIVVGTYFRSNLSFTETFGIGYSYGAVITKVNADIERGRFFNP